MRERLDDADGAVVGTITNASGKSWTIDIERDLKGNVGRKVSFVAGLRPWAREGERVGLLLHRDHRRWVSNMCDSVPPERLFIAAAPPAPARGRGVPRLLASGFLGAPRVAVMDERGDFTQYGLGEHDAAVAVCPGERYYAEAVYDTSDFSERGSAASVEIRDARTMRVVRRNELPKEIGSALWRRPRSIACRDEEATDVLVSAEAGEYSARIVRSSGDDWRTVYHGKARAVTFTPDGFALINYHDAEPQLVVHDSEGRVLSRLGPLPSFKTLSISEPVAFAADQSGRFVAGLNEEPGDEVHLFIANLRTGKVRNMAFSSAHELAWSGGDLIVSANEGVTVIDVFGTRSRNWKGWSGRKMVVVGDRVFGVREEKDRTIFVSAPYRTGPEKEERDLGDITIDQLLVLSGERDLADRRRASPTWAVYGVGLAVVILGAIVWRSRRTD